mgnify:CR=1 FL=1
MPRNRRARRSAVFAAIIAAVGVLGVQLSAETGPSAAHSGRSSALPALQPMIDAAKEGDVVAPAAGRYAGPVLIDKPLTLDGSNGVEVDGGGKGTVIHVRTNGATVRNMRVVNSGDQHNDIDAGIRIEGNFNVVKDNVIEEALFGIDLQEAHNNVVRRNRIGSKADAELGVKGDAERLWYARSNRLEENIIRDSRDFVIWYSSGNTVVGNQVSMGRYGLHLMYARDNTIEDNRFDRNAVGIYLMYDEGDVIRRNRIVQALGAAGVGIGLKEVSNVLIEDNEVLYNAVGLAFDITPFQPGSTVEITGNTIAFNDIGVSFLSDRPGNIFKDNRFLSNTQHVAMRLFESAARAEWSGNHWDDYQGFDQNRDGIGDKPYAMRSFADRLWMDVPNAGFFKGSPALSVLDFIERLAPFTEPLLLLKDKEPRVSKDFVVSTSVKDRSRPAAKPEADEDAEGPAPISGGAGADEPPSERIDPFGLYKK